MIQRIENKINEYAMTLLDKENLTADEVACLATIVTKLKADEQAAKWVAEKKSVIKKIAALLAKTFKI